MVFGWHPLHDFRGVCSQFGLTFRRTRRGDAPDSVSVRARSGEWILFSSRLLPIPRTRRRLMEILHFFKISPVPAFSNEPKGSRAQGWFRKQ